MADKSVVWQREGRVLSALLAAAVFMRLFCIQRPEHAVYSEENVLNALQKYAHGVFFIERIPPGGRLVLFFLAKLFFGADLKKDVFAGTVLLKLRIVTALLGSLIVPLCYLTLRVLGCSGLAALTTAAALLAESTILTQTRFATDECVFMLSLVSAALFFSLWRRNSARSGSVAALLGAGISCGLAVSSRLLGFLYCLPFAAVGLYDAWRQLGKKPAGQIAAGAATMALCLGCVPVLAYLLAFRLHIGLLPNKSPESMLLLSREFQAGLAGETKIEAFHRVSYGSVVTIKQLHPENGYLHSHPSVYPEGSKQQQVTVYHHRDGNNNFQIRQGYQFSSSEEEGQDEEMQISVLRSGDVIRLEHVSTGRYLHSHPIGAPSSDSRHNNEVSCYGGHGRFSDSNDNWRIEIVDAAGKVKKGSKGQAITAMDTYFRLRHVNTKHRLHSRGKRLPAWAHAQVEVTCGRETRKENSVWVFEENTHRLFAEDEKKVSYKDAAFLQKVSELHRGFFEVPSTLRSIEHIPPAKWALGKKQLLFLEEEGGEEGRVLELFLAPNRLLYFLCFFSVVFGLCRWLGTVFATQLGLGSGEADAEPNGLLLLYVLGYAPHFFTKRTQTLYDYLPLLYISFLHAGLLLSSALAKIPKDRKYRKHVACGVCLAGALRFFAGSYRQTFVL